MTMNAFDQMLDVVGRAESLGSRTLSTGVRLIGHIPHLGSEGYLHVLYPPLEDGQISVIEQQVGRKFHADLKAFYRRTNGLSLFASSLAFDGLRTSYVRIGDAARQPSSIVTPNVRERPVDVDDKLVFFGFYQSDGSHLGMSADSPTVYRYAPGTARVLNKWPSFDAMLRDEVNRLSQLFDTLGRKIDNAVPTCPTADIEL